jgi:hypothetical protein
MVGVATVPYVDTFADYLRASANAEEERLDNVRKKRMPHKRDEYQDLPSYKEMRNSAIRKMENLDKGMKHLKESGGIRLGHLQYKLWDSVEMVCIQRMYLHNN